MLIDFRSFENFGSLYFRDLPGFENLTGLLFAIISPVYPLFFLVVYFLAASA